MAVEYTILAQQQVLEFVPPNQTRKVMEITAREAFAGIVFTFRLPRAAYTPDEVNEVALSFAYPLTAAGAQPGVVSIDADSDIQAGQVVASLWDIGIESSSGNSSIVMQVADTILFGDHTAAGGFNARVQQAVAQLDAAENL